MMVETNSTNSTILACLIKSDFQDTLLHDTNLPSSVKPTKIVLAIVNGVAALPTFFINLLIIWSVLENKNLRSNSYGILLAALAFTDLLVGLTTEPASTWQLGCGSAISCYVPCLYTIAFLIGLVSLSMSMSTLMMVTLERYLAIKHPFFHRENVTSKRITIATTAAWMITPTTVLVPRLALTANNNTMKKIPALVTATVHVVVILYCTIIVQIAANRQRKGIIAQLVAVQTNNQESDTNPSQELKVRLQEHKRGFTMVILVLATFVCYCPIIITVIIETVYGKNVTENFKYIAQAISSTFINIQSLVNPLIVSLRMSDIHTSVKKKLLCCSGIKRVEHNTISANCPTLPGAVDLS